MTMNPNQNPLESGSQPQQPQPQPEVQKQPQVEVQQQTTQTAQPQTQPNVQPTLPQDPEPSMINTDDIPSNSTYRDGLKPPPKRSALFSSFKGFLSIAELVTGALILALGINSFVFQSYQVFGQSMEPTLQQGNRLIVSKLSKSWAGVLNNEWLPNRGTIIIFVNPRNPDVQLVKRVIGLPGERVLVNDGSITVFNEASPNGFDPDTPYKDQLVDFTTGSVDITVPDGHIFVSGDNRTPGGSLDSRNDLGTVPLDNIIGNLSMRIFPLSEAEFY